MNYQQTLDWMYARLPMFTRIGAAAIKKDLTNTIELCRLLGDPHRKFKSIHIAGTNGKGSVSHMLASVLQEAGYKTGLYTSPHLLDFRERIKINGQMIPEEDVVAFVEKHKGDFERIEPSFFEMTVALAFDYFTREKVDVAVIETGLGGGLDSTNIITPELSIITNIGWDHTDMLGDSLSKIAAEKAGIIKDGVPVVIGERSEESSPVFERMADEQNAPLVFAEDYFSIRNFVVGKGRASFDLLDKATQQSKSLQSQLNGIYQEKNLATVACALHLIKENSLFTIHDRNVERGLVQCIDNTGLLGRWQQLSEKPLTFCDTGHNSEGISMVIRQIKLYTFRQLHIVFGMVKDKDISKVLALLPREASYYFCNAKLPRALPAGELQEQAAVFQLKGELYPTVVDAFTAARKAATEDDFIFIGGSTFVVAEALELIRG